MRVFIIEDEVMAQIALEAALVELFPDTVVAGTAKSVKEAVAWLNNPDHKVDMIFMDVELSDGKCFEIFRQARISAPVIMTTAYDSYAVKAFEVNSRDYLLKPIEPSALKRAVERCRTYKQHLMVKYGNSIQTVNTGDIACIYSEDKSNHLVTRKGAAFMLDDTLDSIAAKLDPSQFIKISRSAIVSRNAVGSLTKLPGGRLRINVPLESGRFTLEVSRSHTDSFLSWLDK